MLKRVFLFVLTNIAIITVISFILTVFNVQPFLTQHGLNYQSLITYALIIGFTGSLISLFVSKWMAIHAFGVRIIDKPNDPTEHWLFSEVSSLAKQNKIGMPVIGIYESPDPNAFATGWNKNNALIAVSTGMLNSMDREGIQGVLGHEVSHVANGDMVTLALIQGVVNTFVIFFARIAAFFVTQLFRKGDGEHVNDGFVYYGVALLFEFIFGVLATAIVMWFSRYREFRADEGSAKIVGKDKMISALEQLKAQTNKSIEDDRAPAFSAMKISHQSKWLSIFASHPPLEKRIEALQKSDQSRSR